ncbi:MAG: glycosyltransferase involved in cell wall biosynthesis [Parasphingorhabdus sp.]|uniref:glycosyltransferase n=1 Tax=Parasphingorhabdus sp. TaxID=2709688 RepID=UPI002B278707|nr:glycosyltransferase [Parasphingorhabdus sp.]
MTKICIVSRNPPAANPRAIKEAEALANAGYDVTIVHASPGGWSDTMSADVVPENVRAIGAPFGPRAPLAVRVRQLAGRKSVRGLARVFGVSEPLAFRGAGDVASDLFRLALKTKSALYIGHYVEGLAAAARAARAHGAMYAFDAEDFHPGDLPDEPASAFDNALLDAIERTHLPGCAYVTAAAPGIADAYAKQYNIPRPTVVLNTFSKSLAPSAASFSSGSKAAQASPSVYWFSQTIGKTRGLENAIRAIAQSQSRPHLYLRGEAAPGYQQTMESLASELGVADRLHFLPPGPPDEMVALAAPYDAGLVGEIGHTFNRRIALTNKQFTYLLAGLPVFMSDVPGHSAFANSAQGAAFLYRTEDPTSLANAMDALLLDETVLAAARERALMLGQNEFCWEKDQKLLLGTIEAALATSQHAGAAL